jgi:ABC-type glycerol-3-phosphate transport system substrate-binding protein
MKKQSLLIVTAVAAVLAACGGGGGGDAGAPAPAPTAEVPDSASQSPQGLADYLMSLSAASADDLEPVDVARFAPPTPDDVEPVAVN